MEAEAEGTTENQSMDVANFDCYLTATSCGFASSPSKPIGVVVVVAFLDALLQGEARSLASSFLKKIRAKVEVLIAGGKIGKEREKEATPFENARRRSRKNNKM